MHPFTVEQLTYQHARELKARGRGEQLVGRHKGANRGISPVLFGLSARLRGRRGRVRPLAPVVPLSSARRDGAEAPHREAS
jgi:hypothetical protein